MSPDCAFSASMNGTRCATACFITRADFTTCGRNILPAPKRSPTTFMPSISGPSITWIGRSAFCRASSVSSTIQVEIPCTSACASRSSTGRFRHERSSSTLLPPLFTVSANFTSRSVASLRRLRITSSTCSSRSFGISA